MSFTATYSIAPGSSTALTQLSWEREGTKFRQTEIVHDIRGGCITSVLKNDVPNYFDVIEHPMCCTMIDAKINKFEQWDFQVFWVRCL